MALVIKDRVKETTTTTGTGNLTLAGAMTGFRAFSSVCSTNDTAYYTIQAVDGTGAPTGDWEVGLGTYSASNTLTRTTVLASSNSGSAVNLAAGTKQVWIDIAAADHAAARGGPAFSAYATSTQTLNSGTAAKVTFGTEEFDTASCYDTSNSRFTPNLAGYYQINANVVLNVNAAYFGLRLYKNGSFYKQGMQHGATVEAGQAAGIGAVVYLNGSSDYVEIYAIQTGGSNGPTYVGSGTGIDVWFTGCYLGVS